MKNLSVFDGVPIPVDYAATQKYVTLGASDSGKTYLLDRFAEQCADADVFFVILDPVGKHWSLRAGPDGKPDGGKQGIWVLGGLHGDLPLDPNSGALIADTVVDHPGRYVLDVSTFETDDEVATFATTFAKRLFRRKMKDPGWPLLLMLEEAETFLPETVQAGQQPMKAAFGRIVRQGRNHGVGVYLVFQRSAAGDKGSISQCKVLIAKQLSHNLDQDAVRKWAKTNGSPEQVEEMLGALASLDVNEAYLWSPTFLKIFKRVKVLPRVTFDASANVKHGQQMTKVELVPLDVDALGAKMSELAERAIEEDPKRLNDKLAEMRAKVEKAERRLGDLDALQTHADEQAQRISQLERELATRPDYEVIREVPVLTEAQLAPLWEIGDDLAGVQAEIAAVREFIQKHDEHFKIPLLTVEPDPDAPGAYRGAPAETPQRSSRPPRREHPSATDPGPPSSNGTDELGKAAREALEVIVAFYPTAPSFLQIGLVLGKYHTAGPFRRALTVLEEQGYTEGGRATDKGRMAVDPARAMLPSPENIQRKWRARFKGSTAEIYDHVLDAHPSAISYAELGRKIGKNHNAGPIRKMFNNLVDWQLAKEVEDASDDGDGLVANDLLFSIRG